MFTEESSIGNLPEPFKATEHVCADGYYMYYYYYYLLLFIFNFEGTPCTNLQETCQKRIPKIGRK
jgi:hypothetical protein